MYIRLNYTANKTLYQLFRVIADIINTPSVVDVTSFYNRANSAGYTPGMISNFDPVTSYIVRTVDPSQTKAHFSGQNSIGTSKFTLEMAAYDDPTSKGYIQYINPSATGSISYYAAYSTAITGGTISSSQLGVNVADANTSYLGTNLTIGGTGFDFTAVGSVYTAGTVSTNTASTTSIRTIHAYVSNTAFLWCTNQTANITGWPTAAQQGISNYSGPWIMSQYTRYDYWNSSSNGVFPLMILNARADGQGLLANDFVYGTNVNYTTVAALAGAAPPFIVLNTYRISSTYGTGTILYTRPTATYGQFVNHTVGTHSSYGALGIANTSLTVGTGSNTAVGLGVATNNKASPISIIPNNRASSQDLTTASFQHQPLGWNCDFWGNFGGTASEQSNIYIFNGEYSAGDEYTVGGKTYVIWPTFDNVMNRIGVSVPKE